jgi:hypothetical protein
MTAAILDFRPAAPPGHVPVPGAATALAQLFALDRLPSGRRQLVCRWHRDAKGRLSAVWEPDIVLVSRR